ncbi:unnamed protein product [Schistosoma mattheei]|uniref:Ubiquinone biosynthesis protein n=1 Tax=Schistosoma mattheei TaxID=31246 RepID=A0A183PHL6_9TREM|nr:unnamed protein product [Schistosoma mattheei]
MISHFSHSITMYLIKISWYAKRLGVAYVYNLTELYMLQDKSPELSESWIFLRKRIEDLRSMKQMNLKAASISPVGNNNEIEWMKRDLIELEDSSKADEKS